LEAERVNETKALMRDGWDIIIRFLGAMAGLFSGSDWKLLLALMALDLLSGLALACIRKSPRSASGGFHWRAILMGICRKGMMLGIILIAGALDQLSGKGDMLRSAAIGFYMAQEAVSLAGNAAHFGVPLPGNLKNALHLLKTANHF